MSLHGLISQNREMTLVLNDFCRNGRAQFVHLCSTSYVLRNYLPCLQVIRVVSQILSIIVFRKRSVTSLHKVHNERHKLSFSKRKYTDHMLKTALTTSFSFSKRIGSGSGDPRSSGP